MLILFLGIVSPSKSDVQRKILFNFLRDFNRISGLLDSGKLPEKWQLYYRNGGNFNPEYAPKFVPYLIKQRKCDPVNDYGSPAQGGLFYKQFSFDKNLLIWIKYVYEYK